MPIGRAIGRAGSRRSGEREGGVVLRVKVLGQLEAYDADGVSLPADGLPRRARQVLGVLAARYDRIQSKDALADAVWGTELPGNHVAALEHYVSVVRRRLQPTGTS